jgi:hypoxanthine phosphoribosyltransferase
MYSSHAEEALEVLRNADQLYSAAEVQAALDRLATAVTKRFQGLDPLMLVVMHGGLIPAGALFARLDFPFHIGYVHVTRYQGVLSGGALHWLAPPSAAVAERDVVVVDDIFDEGATLKAIARELRRSGARSVHTAVLVDKRHDRKVADFRANFVGLEVEDRYVFGCGMDYKEYWRNLPAIYALASPDSERSP